MILLDTNSLAYATERQDDPKFADIGSRLKHYLTQLQDAETPVGVPSLVVYEYLCGYPVEEHGGIIATLESNFIVFDVGVAVASKAAELFRSRPTNTGEKQRAKLDTLIAATAVIEGATTILSEDRDYTALTQGRIETKKPSQLPKPPRTLLDELPDQS